MKNVNVIPDRFAPAKQDRESEILDLEHSPFAHFQSKMTERSYHEKQ
jgi:hypothetical protein